MEQAGSSWNTMLESIWRSNPANYPICVMPWEALNGQSPHLPVGVAAASLPRGSAWCLFYVWWWHQWGGAGKGSMAPDYKPVPGCVCLEAGGLGEAALLTPLPTVFQPRSCWEAFPVFPP